MAKYEGDQNVPSGLLDLYRGTLNPHPTGKIVKKRYPFRMPRMQEGGKGVHSGQLAQRERFKTIKGNFKNLSSAERARWYAAEPPWSSFLWYYNYFMMSGLVGNADIAQGGAGVVKTIQVMKASVPTTGTHVFTLGTEVIAAKTVVMIQGSARKILKVFRGSGSVAPGGATLEIGDTITPDRCVTELEGASWKDEGESIFSTCRPYVSNLSATQISIAWDRAPAETATIGWQIIEHDEGVVHPIQVSISNTEVVIDWAEVPDAAADVSITVIEYV